MTLMNEELANCSRGRVLWLLFWNFFKIALFVVGGGFAIILAAEESFVKRLRWLKEGGLVAALVKPQFELGPHQTDKGVVRDPALRQQAVDKVLLFCQERLGLECLGVVPAAVKGPKGNQEYIVCLRRVGAGQVACGSEVEQ